MKGLISMVAAYSSILFLSPTRAYLGEMIGETMAETQITFLPAVWLLTAMKVAEDVKSRLKGSGILPETDDMILIEDKGYDISQDRYEYEYRRNEFDRFLSTTEVKK